MTTSDYYQSLGYNVDYKTSNDPSPKPDTSREYYVTHVLGKKANEGLSDREINIMNSWAQNINDQYNQYLNWYQTNWETDYNSEENKIKRAIAAGQNPYYLGSTVGNASTMSVPQYDQPSQTSEQSALLNTVQAGISTALQMAQVLQGMRKVDADIDYVDQQVIGKTLENEQSAIYLGHTKPSPTNLDYLDEVETDPSELPPARVVAHAPSLPGLNKRQSKKFQMLADELPTDNRSLFYQNKDYQNKLLDSTINAKDEETRYRSAGELLLLTNYEISQLSLKERQQYDKEVYPLVIEMQKGEKNMSDAAIYEKGMKKLEGTKFQDLGQAILTALFFVGRHISPTMSSISYDGHTQSGVSWR